MKTIHPFNYEKYRINAQEYLQERQAIADMPPDIQQKFLIGKLCMAVLMPLGAAITLLPLSLLYIILIAAAILFTAFFIILKIEKDLRLCVYALICFASGMGFGYWLLPDFIYNITAIMQGA